jgi:hypothetical protein
VQAYFGKVFEFTRFARTTAAIPFEALPKIRPMACPVVNCISATSETNCRMSLVHAIPRLSDT